MSSTSTLSIRISLFLVILVSAVVLAGGVLTYGHLQHSQAALIAADDVMERGAETVLVRTNALIRPIGTIATLAARWPEIETHPSRAGHAARERIISLLSTYQQISSMYSGYDNGDFYQVYNVKNLSPHFVRELEGPQNAAFVERLIVSEGDGRRREIWRFLDEKSDILGSTESQDAVLDPRTRPWFKLASKTNETARTDVYRFQSSGDPGITFSRRHRDGVFGVDITLAELSQFLRSDANADKGRLFIVEPGVGLLASSLKQTSHASGDEPKDIASTTRDILKDPIIAAVANQMKKSKGEALNHIDVGGEPWIARLEPMDFGQGKTAFLAIALPMDAVIGPILQIERETMLVSAGLLLLAFPVVWFIARLLSRPLQSLTRSTRRIQELDFSQPIKPSSRIYEIRRLQDSMHHLENGLKTFGLYLPKSLVRRFVDSDITPSVGGERKEISLLFTDVAGFTEYAESLQPEELMSTMSEYFEALTNALIANGATIDKYIGDAIMAIWNAPDDQPDHVIRACRGALAAKSANEALNARWHEQGRAQMPTRFGLHVGDAVIGNVGSSDRLNYTAIGASVNLASRLEGVNRTYGTSILVSEQVVERASDAFLFRSIDDAKLKGMSQPVLVYELLSDKQAEHETNNQAWLSRWEAARALFKEQRFESATDAYAALAEERPDDRVARIMRDMAQDFAKSLHDAGVT